MAQRKYAPITPINLSKVPKQVAEAMLGHSDPDHLIYWYGLTGNSEGIQLITRCHILHIIHWTIKLKYDKKHRMPFAPYGKTNTYKPVGMLYSQALDLCLALPEKEVQKHAKNSATLWGAILCELAIEGKVGDTKAESIVLCKKQNASLRDFENPFSSDTEPYTTLMVDIALKMANSDDAWRRKFWNSFKKSRSEWVKNLSNPEWRHLFLKDGTWFIRLEGKDNKATKIHAR